MTVRTLRTIFAFIGSMKKSLQFILCIYMRYIWLSVDLANGILTINNSKKDNSRLVTMTDGFNVISGNTSAVSLR
ncbi:hypothetical protein [Sutcliffiella sp. NC1]|uniref:hypothetical protein n=1 Tax=Sutcliffiella sp. NC1 TaxID=3004096 RepID=UPI0022DD84C0|nr:hypothetical protein [Sutcliffiella sp. NC1]WBL14776.1 hypothetical protein O1A01_23360 [Sutcliffiella sp. NC1]